MKTKRGFIQFIGLGALLILVSFLGYSYTITGNVISSGDLIAQWTFDEGSGIIVGDSSGNGFNGAINGSTWTTGYIGGALNFDGVDDYVDLGTMDINSGKMTITFWAYMNEYSSTNMRFISKATGSNQDLHWWMVSESNTYLRFRLKTLGATKTFVASNYTLPTNTWFHAAAVYDGIDMILYLDGIEIGRTFKTGTINVDNTVPVWIGANPGGTEYLNGSMDDVRIYSTALSAQDILDLYNWTADCGNGVIDFGETCDDNNTISGDGCSSTCQIESGGLVAHYEFEEGNGTTTGDSSLNNNLGTLFNGTSFTTGYYGGGLNFDGVDDFVEIPLDPSLDITEEITLSAWVNPSATGQSQATRFISKRTTPGGSDVYAIGFWTSSLNPFFRITSGDIETNRIATNTIPLNTWSHIIGTYDGTTMRLYINGVEDTSVSKTGLIDLSTIEVHLGDRKGEALNRRFNGTMDDVRIYNIALNATEVMDLYIGPVCGNNITETGETCDDGNNVSLDGCSSTCQIEVGGAVCGNNITESGETCDDGNNVSLDGCSATCQLELLNCGDGIVDFADGEVCDLTNNSGLFCDDFGFNTGTLLCSPDCLSFNLSQCNNCGNNITDPGEQCDGGDIGNNTCDSIGQGFVGGILECQFLTCDFDVSSCTLPDPCTFTAASWSATNATEGDVVFLTVNGSSCVDGTIVNFNVFEEDFPLSTDEPASVNPLSVNFIGGVATTNWTVEWQCDGEAGGICVLGRPEYYFIAELASDSSVSIKSENPKLDVFEASETCGNGIVGGSEQCDDGNLNNSDGCSDICEVESDYSCEGELSVCVTSTCGDGIVGGAEQCDDGNTISGDGCSNICQFEINGIISHWTFDEGNGAIVGDSSGHGFDGNVIGANWSSGNISGGMFFDGVNDYVEIASNPSFDVTTKLTIAAWVYPTAVGQANGSRIVSRTVSGGGNDTYSLGLVAGTTTPVLIIKRTSSEIPTNYITSSSLPLNTWSHVAATYDSDDLEFRIYINGEVDISIKVFSIIDSSTGDIHLGDIKGGEEGRRFEGMLDDVRIYNVGLTQVDVQDIMGGTRDLLLNLEFYGDLLDSSGNRNHGGCINCPVLTTDRNSDPIRAYLFDGVNDYINITDSFSLDIVDDLTVTAWINPTLTSGETRIVNNRGTGVSGNNPGWQLKIRDFSGRWGFMDSSIDDGNLYATCDGCGGTYSYEEWHYVAMVYEKGVGLKFYVDGLSDGNISATTLGSIDNNLPTAIGGAVADNGVEGTFNEFFEGSIDDVRIYSRALSSQEVADSYSPIIITPNVLAAMNFDDGGCSDSQGGGWVAVEGNSSLNGSIGNCVGASIDGSTYSGDVNAGKGAFIEDLMVFPEKTSGWVTVDYLFQATSNGAGQINQNFELYDDNNNRACHLNYDGNTSSLAVRSKDGTQGEDVLITGGSLNYLRIRYDLINDDCTLLVSVINWSLSDVGVSISNGSSPGSVSGWRFSQSQDNNFADLLIDEIRICNWDYGTTLGACENEPIEPIVTPNVLTAMDFDFGKCFDSQGGGWRAFEGSDGGGLYGDCEGIGIDGSRFSGNVSADADSFIGDQSAFTEKNTGWITADYLFYSESKGAATGIKTFELYESACYVTYNGGTRTLQVEVFSLIKGSTVSIFDNTLYHIRIRYDIDNRDCTMLVSTENWGMSDVGTSTVSTPNSSEVFPVIGWRFSQTPTSSWGDLLIDEVRICRGDYGSVVGACENIVFDPCNITSATWSTSNANEGNNVTLSVTGTNCEGELVDFLVFEEDGLSSDDPSIVTPSSSIFSGGSSSSTWIAEDGDLDGDSEFYFMATLNSNSTATLNSSIMIVDHTVIPNNPPVLAAIGDQTVTEGVLLSFIVSASDADNDTLNYSAISLPAGSNFDELTQTFIWTPSFSSSGTYNVNFSVSDGTDIDSETINIFVIESFDDDGDTVLDVNDTDPLDPFVCQDLDSDTCDDCSVLGVPNVANDGADNESDGICDAGDPDDDNDGDNDVTDCQPFNPAIYTGAIEICLDGIDNDCDLDVDLADSDCSLFDQDGDGVPDVNDTNPTNPNICADVDGDSCEDCLFGFADTNNDGPDLDSDGICDAGDLQTCGLNGVEGSEECDGSDFGVFDGTCNNYNSSYVSGNLACTSGCIINENACLLPDPCNITSASWSTSNANEGDNVILSVTGTNCEGELVDFLVWDDDPIDSLVSVQPSPSTFTLGVASTTWIAIDGDKIIFNTNSEFYFVGTLNSNSSSNITSGNLDVTDIVIPNNPPVLTSIGNKNVTEGALLSFTVSATDADNDTLNYSIVSPPFGAVFDKLYKSFNWTPSFNQSGIYSITFIVDDGTDTDSEVIDILVNDFVAPDDDYDGVPNVGDKCPNTPNGTVVNLFNGCPPPIYTKFDSSLTTNFSLVPNLLSVDDLSLGIAGKGRIEFSNKSIPLLRDNGFGLEPLDLDRIIIDTNLIGIDTSSIDYSSFDRPAKLTFYQSTWTAEEKGTGTCEGPGIDGSRFSGDVSAMDSDRVGQFGGFSEISTGFVTVDYRFQASSNNISEFIFDNFELRGFGCLVGYNSTAPSLIIGVFNSTAPAFIYGNSVMIEDAVPYYIRLIYDTDNGDCNILVSTENWGDDNVGTGFVNGANPRSVVGWRFTQAASSPPFVDLAIDDIRICAGDFGSTPGACTNVVYAMDFDAGSCMDSKAGFTNPGLMRDGVYCSTCPLLSNTNNTVQFRVPGFSNYSIEEDPVIPPTGEGDTGDEGDGTGPGDSGSPGGELTGESSGSSPVISSIVNDIVINLDEVSSGKFDVSLNQLVYIIYGGATYSIEILDVVESRARMIIHSTVDEFIVGEREAVLLDLDLDGSEDIGVSYIATTTGYELFIGRTKDGEIESEFPYTISENIVDIIFPGKEIKSPNVILIVIGISIFLITIILVVVVRMFKRRKLSLFRRRQIFKGGISGSMNISREPRDILAKKDEIGSRVSSKKSMDKVSKKPVSRSPFYPIFKLFSERDKAKSRSSVDRHTSKGPIHVKQKKPLFHGPKFKVKGDLKLSDIDREIQKINQKSKIIKKKLSGK